MNVLTIDIGGTNVKILASGQKEPRKFPSGRTLTPNEWWPESRSSTGDWKYDVVSIGYPGRVVEDRAVPNPTISPTGGSGSTSQRRSDVR